MGFEWKSLAFDQGSSPEAQLLAFTLLLRASLRPGNMEPIAVDLPRAVYQSMSPDTFRAIFSDSLLERDPAIESRLQIRVVDDLAFGYGRRASEDR